MSYLVTLMTWGAILGGAERFGAVEASHYWTASHLVHADYSTAGASQLTFEGSGGRDLASIDSACRIIHGHGITQREANALILGWSMHSGGTGTTCNAVDGTKVTFNPDDLLPPVNP